MSINPSLITDRSIAHASPLSVNSSEPIEKMKLEDSMADQMKAGTIKTAVFFAKALGTILTLGVVGPLMLAATILTGGWAWNEAMSAAFLPSSRLSRLSGKPTDEQQHALSSIPQGIIARKRTEGANMKAENREMRNMRNITFEPLKVPNGHGVLDGFFVGEKGSDKAPTVVYFCQNATRYEESIELARKYAEDHKCNVVMWNYPGVGLSTGSPPKSADDLVNSGRAILKHVTTELGIKEENLILHGSSIGGALATVLSKEYPQAHLRNERSFTKWSDAAQSLVNKYTFIGALVKLITGDGKWELDAAKSWQERESIQHRGFTWFETASNDEILDRTSRIGLQIYEQEYFEANEIVHTEHANIGHNDNLPLGESAEIAFITKVKEKINQKA